MESEYVKQANDFAKKYGVKLTFIGEPEYKKYFPDDKESRYVFKCKLTRNKKSYTFSFGQSIMKGCNEPSMYDILTSIEKYDPYSFEEFCSNYVYDEDSRKAEKIYNACVKEYEAVERLFGDVLEELCDIC